MDADLPTPTIRSSLMSAADYRESLRRYKPTVYVDGQLIESVPDAPSLAPGVNALGVSYDFALDPALAPLMTARQTTSATGEQLADRKQGSHQTRLKSSSLHIAEDMPRSGGDAAGYSRFRPAA